MLNVPAVDALGKAQAKAAALEIEIQALKAQIKALGEGAHEGKLFRATVTAYDAVSLDKAKLADALGLDPDPKNKAQWAPFEKATPAIRIGVKARTGEDIAA
jgi:hypothetical protein